MTTLWIKFNGISVWYTTYHLLLISHTYGIKPHSPWTWIHEEYIPYTSTHNIVGLYSNRDRNQVYSYVLVHCIVLASYCEPGLRLLWITWVLYVLKYMLYWNLRHTSNWNIILETQTKVPDATCISNVNLHCNWLISAVILTHTAAWKKCHSTSYLADCTAQYYLRT